MFCVYHLEDMLFNMSKYTGVLGNYKHALKTWIESNKIKTTEVNCDEFLFKKLLIGDKSDNVPSVVVWQKAMKDCKIRTYSITEKMADKIFAQYTKENETFVIDQLFIDNELETLAEIVYRVIGKESVNLIKNNIFQNMSLMMLHSKIIPDAIQEQIYQGIENCFLFLDEMDISKLTNKDKILENTEWLKINQAKKADIFSNLDETNKPKKLKLIGKKRDNKLF